MSIWRDLRCPACHTAVEVPATGDVVCAGCAARYPVRDGVPALVTPTSALYASISQEATRPSRLSVSTDAEPPAAAPG